MKLFSRKHGSATAGCCCAAQTHGADTPSAEDAHAQGSVASMPDTPAPPDPRQPVAAGGSHGRHGTHGDGC